jgi:hypothetical protein
VLWTFGLGLVRLWATLGATICSTALSVEASIASTITWTGWVIERRKAPWRRSNRWNRRSGVVGEVPLRPDRHWFSWFLAVTATWRLGQNAYPGE